MVGVLAMLVGCAGSAHGGGAGAARTEPAEAITRDVTFASGELALAGTLHVPAGSGRRPAVVLLHGSGPQSRDGEMEGQLAMGFGCSIDVLEELAEGLQDAGFAVLRYDKRTCGPFNDCGDNEYPVPGLMHVVGELAQDATAAAKWLAAQPEIDRDRIWVLGHSEGGVLVPKLLTEVGELHGGVMLAAPYSPIDRVLEEQATFLNRVLEAQGMSAEERDAILKGLKEQVRDVRALRAGTFKGGMIGGAPAPYWQSLMKLGDEAPLLATATPKPLLALSGDYDWNVPPSETAAWDKTFALEPNPAHATQVIPCVTHAQNCIHQPDSSKIRQGDIDCEVDARVITSIAQFMRKH